MKRLGSIVLALSILSFGACKKEEAAPAKPADPAAKTETPPADKAPEAPKADPAAPTAPAADPAAPTGAPAAPVAVSPEMEAMGKEMLGMMTKMADVVDANKADCKKMAEALKKFGDENKDMVNKAKEMSAKISPEQKQAWSQAHMAEFQGVIGKMMGGMTACQNDADVQNALKGMALGPM